MKVASFTVHATMPQSIRWKQAADGEGFGSVGSWAGKALDAYLEARTRAGRPIPLSWFKGAFRVVLDGREVHVHGMVSPPFAYYQGNAAGLDNRNKPRTLVNLRTGRVIATLRTARQCRSLAAELAPVFARDEVGTTTVERHVSEQA